MKVLFSGAWITRPRNDGGEKSTIYALIDPRDFSVRYVGKTVEKIQARLRGHISEARRSSKTYHRLTWIRHLLAGGKTPEIRPLEIVDKKDESAAERRWVSAYRARGADLVNGTDGGEGASGRAVSEETRRKISQSKVGRPGRKHTLETRAKMRAPRGERFTELARERARQANTGRKIPRDIVEKSAAKRRGKKFSPAHRAAISEALRGKPKTATARANMSKSAQRRTKCRSRSPVTGQWVGATPSEQENSGTT